MMDIKYLLYKTVEMERVKFGYKKIGLLLTICLISSSYSYAAETNIRKTISVIDYGAIPDDGKDDTKALRKAVSYCRTNPGTTLIMPAGV